MGMSVEIIHEKKNKLDTLRRNRIEKGCTICGESGHNRKTCKKRQEEHQHLQHLMHMKYVII